MTEKWQTNDVGGSGGCMADGKGTLYMSGGNNNIVAVDTETLQVETTYPVPQYVVHGILRHPLIETPGTHEERHAA